jgi:hypothetical protein
MDYFEACEIYQDLVVNLQYAEVQEKKKEQVFEEFAQKYGAETVRECVETIRKQQDKEHQNRLDVLRMVKKINGGFSMNGSFLNLLIIKLNQKIRECKEKLEVEEKSKEVAFLQGHLSGYKELIKFLCAEFELTQVFIEDAGDDAPELPNMDVAQIKALLNDVTALATDERWERVTESVTNKALELKDYLLLGAENARDLYITQAKYEGMTLYKKLCVDIEGEKRRRVGELDFESEEEAPPLEHEETPPPESGIFEELDDEE